MANLTSSTAKILNAVKTTASLGYRDRIPDATKANLAKTAKLIHDNELLWNEFYQTLLDRIGAQYFHNSQFENRLKPFKKGMSFGAVAQLNAVNLIPGEEYDVNNVDPWSGAARPDLKTQWLRKNRNQTYGYEVNEQLLYEAMTEEGTLSEYLASIWRVPNQSAEWDEYLIMRNLFADYNAQYGLPNFQVPDLATSDDIEADAKTLTERIRAHYLKMKGFYSRDYNMAGVDAVGGDMVLLATPDVLARQDVWNLASAFNMGKAEWLSDQTITVDDFGIPGCQAILVDRQTFACWDILYKNATIYNPRNDSLYSYLHARGIYGLSLFGDVLMFSTAATNLPTAASTAPTVTTVAVTLAEAVAGNKVLEPGAEIQLNVTVTYSDSTTDGDAYYIITAGSAEAVTNGTAPVIMPDLGTYVDRHGVLHVAEDSDYEALTVTAISSQDGTKSGNIALVATDASDGD